MKSPSICNENNILLCHSFVPVSFVGLSRGRDASRSRPGRYALFGYAGKECARLYTAEYEVHKLVLKDDPLRVKGNLFQRAFDVKVPIGERKVMIPLDVTLKAYIDFTGFDEKNVLRSGDRIVVTLPDPRVVVTSSRINHDEVKQFVSLTRSDYTSAELADFTRQGEDEILASVPQLGILEMARENAAHVLVPMLTRLGYDERNIVISFRKDFTTADMPLLLEREGRTEKLK